MKKRTAITAVILTLIMTFMEMSALPAALFCNIKIEDIDPIYITLMLNFLLAFAICWVWRVVIEGIVYYIGVGIMEELYLRGLLQNIIAKWFGERKNAILYAILITSVLFGLGHIFGALGQPIATVIAKTVWATALGVYFGAVYAVSKNLWVPIILHLIINLCGIPFCFSTSNRYPTIALIACLVSYVLLAVYGIYILRKNNSRDNA